MARRKRSKTKRAAPAAIVVRAPAPIARRRGSSSPRVIVGRVARRSRRGGSGGGGASRVVGDVLTVVSAAALGWARSSEKIPDRIVGVDLPFVLGTAMTIVPFVFRGKVGRYIGDAGAGISAVAAYRLALGTKFYINPKDEPDKSGFEDDEDY